MSEPPDPLYAARAEVEALLEMAVADMVALQGGGAGAELATAGMLIRRGAQLAGAVDPPLLPGGRMRFVIDAALRSWRQGS